MPHLLIPVIILIIPLSFLIFNCSRYESLLISIVSLLIFVHCTNFGNAILPLNYFYFNSHYYFLCIYTFLCNEINEKISQSIRDSGWLPNLFRSIVSRAKDFLQNLIREKDIPPKPTLDIDISEFRHMRSLMIKVQDRAREIKHLQDKVLPDLKQQLAELERKVKESRRPAEKERYAPPERESVRDQLRRLQAEGKQQRTRKKSQDRGR